MLLSPITISPLSPTRKQVKSLYQTILLSLGAHAS